MATKKELRANWISCEDEDNFVFLFDDDGDPVAWCSACVTCDSWEILEFEGKISHLIEAKESFKEKHAYCKPRQSEATKQEAKQGDGEMGRCLRDEIYRLWNKGTGKDGLIFFREPNDELIAKCCHCLLVTEYFSLAHATKITEALKKEIEADKAAFIERHKDCVVKAVEEQEASEPKTETIEAFERRIHELAKQVADTVIRKHKDYGRSGLQSPLLAPHIPPLDALLVRQSDKYSRIQNLLKKGTPEVKESIMDTALDILGYDMLIAVEVERLMNV